MTTYPYDRAHNLNAGRVTKNENAILLFIHHMGFPSSTSQLSLSRFGRDTPPNQPTCPAKVLTSSRKVDECNPLIHTTATSAPSRRFQTRALAGGAASQLIEREIIVCITE